MSYAPPPPGPPPPGYGAPPGYGQQGGFYYGPPMAPGAPMPHAARGGNTAIIAVFIGALIGVAVLVGIIVLAGQPKQPAACPPGQFCPPVPPPSFAPVASSTPAFTLPPLTTPLPTTPGQTAAPTPAGQTPGPVGTPVPTPASNAAPHVAGTVWRSSTLGYSFEYDSGLWTLQKEDAAYAELKLGFRNSDVLLDVIGFPGSTSVDSALQEIYTKTDTFVIGRTANTRPYDALLGPGIGYIRGEGDTFLGTLKNSDGTPGDPVSVTAMGATDGKSTVVVVVLVANPDKDLGGDTLQHGARQAADDIVKTFLWSGG